MKLTQNIIRWNRVNHCLSKTHLAFFVEKKCRNLLKMCQKRETLEPTLQLDMQTFPLRCAWQRNLHLQQYSKNKTIIWRKIESNKLKGHNICIVAMFRMKIGFESKKLYPTPRINPIKDNLSKKEGYFICKLVMKYIGFD